MLAVVGGFSGTGVARAQSVSVWRERDVVRVVSARSPDVRAARAAERVARAAEVAPGLRPNPSVAWEREQVFAPGAAQDVVRLSVPIDLSSRTRTRRAIARVDTAFAGIEVAAARVAAVERAVVVFDEAIAAERRVVLADAELAALDEAVRVVRSRESSGGAAGYDVLRLEIEAELVRSRRADAQGEARVARAALAAMVGLDPSELPRLEGHLESRDPGDVRGSIATALRERIELRAARRVIATAREASGSTGGAWIPSVTLSGGLDLAHESDTTAVGYVASVGVELPFASRGQDTRAEARAAVGLAAARADALASEVRREVMVAHEELSSARAEGARFERETTARVGALRTAADAGYREGARTVTELLDARRAMFEIESRRLHLTVRARRAWVALRRATGELR